MRRLPLGALSTPEEIIASPSTHSAEAFPPLTDYHLPADVEQRLSELRELIDGR